MQPQESWHCLFSLICCCNMKYRTRIPAFPRILHRPIRNRRCTRPPRSYPQKDRRDIWSRILHHDCRSWYSLSRCNRKGRTWNLGSHCCCSFSLSPTPLCTVFHHIWVVARCSLRVIRQTFEIRDKFGDHFSCMELQFETCLNLQTGLGKGLGTSPKCLLNCTPGCSLSASTAGGRARRPCPPIAPFAVH